MKTMFVCASLLTLGLGAPMAAETLVARVPVWIDAIGGKCDRAAGNIAPGADGKDVEHLGGHSDYVIPGDLLEAEPQMGIGVRVRIHGFGPGQSARVEIVHPSGQHHFWDYDIGPSGMIEFSYLPRIGGILSEGRYLFSVLDDGEAVFTTAITLAGSTSTGVCATVS